MPGTDHPEPATDRRWGRIPAWWLDHPELDADGLAVLAALATYADEQGVCWPSQSTLAAKLKRSRPTVNRILQRLDAIGLVAIEGRSGRDGARLSCRYRLRLSAGEQGIAAAVPATRPNAAAGPDRDDSATDTPCRPASQEQPHSEQIPDPLPGRAAQGGHAVPEGWAPDAADLAWARRRFPDADLARHAEAFVLRCQAHGYRYRDVGAAWRCWLVQDMAAPRRPSTSPPGAAVAGAVRPRAAAGEGAAQTRLAGWMAAAARLDRASSVPVRPEESRR